MYLFLRWDLRLSLKFIMSPKLILDCWFSCLHLPRITEECHHAWFFYAVLRTEPRVSGMWSKQSTNWATPSDSFLLVLVSSPIYFKIFCIIVHVCAHESRCLRRPEEGVGFPGPGVVHLLIRVLETALGSCARTVCSFNCSTIFQHLVRLLFKTSPLSQRHFALWIWWANYIFTCKQ